MKCKFCGAELDEGMNVCPSCQHVVSESEQEAVEEVAAEAEETVEEVAAEAEETVEEVTAEAEETVEEVTAEADAKDVAAPMPIEAGEKKKKFPIIAVVLCALAACAVVALILFGPKLISSLKNIGRSNSTDLNSDGGALTDHSVYSVDDVQTPDDSRMQQITAACGDTQLLNSDLQILFRIEYQNFMYYAPYYAMYGMETPDESLPLSEQIRTEDSLTWEQSFLESALAYGNELLAAKEDGEANGFVLDEESQQLIDSIAQTLEEEATSNGYDSTLSYVQDGYGKGVSVESFIRFYSLFVYASAYEQELYNNLTCTEEEVNAFYENNPDVMTANGVSKESATVRHILITPDDADEDGISTDDEWAAAEAEAQSVYALYLEDPTEEYFIELAGTYNEDPGSAETGGLYENVIPGQMVEEFNDWIFVETHEKGDCEIVKTTYGYHIMYFIESGENADWYTSCEELCKDEMMQKEIEAMIARHEMKVWYNAIVIDDVQKSTDTEASE